ncbi:MAG: hypothetical protein RL417_1396 [Pseudomonadota bacterium]|jgi:flagellar FliL protein
MANEAEQQKEEGEGKAPEGGAAAASAKNQKLMVIVGAVVALLVVGGAAAFFLSSGSKSPASGTVDPDAAGSEEPVVIPEGGDDFEELQEGEEPLGAIFPLEAFVVNLSGGRFIRCQVQLEFTSREVPRKFYPRVVAVRDALISLLASKTQDDLLSSRGRDALKDEVKDAVNELLRKEEVKRVYFTQFVIQ